MFSIAVRLDEYNFSLHKVSYLVHKISEHRIDPVKKNIDAVVSYPTLIKAKNARAFLVLANYCHRFIKNCVQVSKPLSDRLKKDTPFS